MKKITILLALLSSSWADPDRSKSRYRARTRISRQLDFDQDPLSTTDLEAMPSAEVDAFADRGGQAFDALLKTVPGNPGQDYPIYAVAPETSFSCEDKLNGGYYADPEAFCQAFHICIADGFGGLAKHSFLCPNGTVFNQNHFICDWWFNVQCEGAEELARVKNRELEEARKEYAATVPSRAREAPAARRRSSRARSRGGRARSRTGFSRFSNEPLLARASSHVETRVPAERENNVVNRRQIEKEDLREFYEENAVDYYVTEPQTEEPPVTVEESHETTEAYEETTSATDVVQDIITVLPIVPVEYSKSESDDEVALANPFLTPDVSAVALPDADTGFLPTPSSIGVSFEEFDALVDANSREKMSPMNPNYQLFYEDVLIAPGKR